MIQSLPMSQIVAELDGFVDAMAMRIASFDKPAIAETKRLVDVASRPSDAEIRPEWEAFLAAVPPGQPEADQGGDGTRLPSAWRCRKPSRLLCRPDRRLNRPANAGLCDARSIILKLRARPSQPPIVS
jgi:hypothetical protein